VKAKLAYVDLDKVWWDKRARSDLGDITSLAETIKEKGVLQPITVTPEFELLAGERRVTAAREAGLVQIPALIRRKEDIIDAKEIELIENIWRKDFTWDEQAELVRAIDTMCRERKVDWSLRKTAQLLDKGLGSVSREIQLAKALEVFPELRQYDNASDALKVIKNLEEQAIVDEMHRRQNVAVATGSLEKGISEMLKMAQKNYHDGEDTFKGLAAMRSDGNVHIIECDPPYGIDLTEQKQSKDSVTSNVHTYNEITRDAYPQFLTKLARELYRVANPNCWLIFWFGPTWQHEVLTSLREAKWEVDEIPAIWAKTQGQTNQPEMYLARGYEPFYLARKGRPVMAKRGRLNVFNYSGLSKKYYPTERPVALIQDILETMGVVMQHVLVPFLGSGATLRAAYNLGISGHGWDISKEYKSKFLLAVEEDARNLNGDKGDAGEET